ncbi:hypothetical protein COOONC_24364, partial [Cooperia oncophora]
DKDVRVPREVAPFRGTTRYAPIAAMKQIEQSRKDDLEGWMYMVVEWTSGGLPWRKYKYSVQKPTVNLRAILEFFLGKCNLIKAAKLQLPHAPGTRSDDPAVHFILLVRATQCEVGLGLSEDPGHILIRRVL